MLSQIRFLMVRLLLLPLVALLPSRLAFALARCRGRRRYRRLSPDVKERMGREVEQVCGPMEDGRVEAILQEQCEIVSCDEMDPYLSLWRRRRGFDRIITLEGLDHLEAATRSGRGAILFSAHFGGGYPWLAALGGRGYRLYGLGAPIHRFALAQRAVLQVRVNLMARASNGGVLFTDHPSFGHEVFAQLRAGALIYLLLDVPPPPGAKRTVDVEFLGRQCRLSYGMLDLAARSGAPVLPFFVYYTAPHLRRAVIGPPIQFISDGDPRMSRTLNLRRCLERIEEAILRAPSHWMIWGGIESLWSPEAEEAGTPAAVSSSPSG